MRACTVMLTARGVFLASCQSSNRKPGWRRFTGRLCLSGHSVSGMYGPASSLAQKAQVYQNSPSWRSIKGGEQELLQGSFLSGLLCAPSVTSPLYYLKGTVGDNRAPMSRSRCRRLQIGFIFTPGWFFSECSAVLFNLFSRQCASTHINSG